MEKLACLEQLYISNNGIEVLENLEENGSLTTIDLASNRISQLDNLQSLQNVEEFWFNDNLVPFSCSILIDLIDYAYSKYWEKARCFYFFRMQCSHIHLFT